MSLKQKVHDILEVRSAESASNFLATFTGEDTVPAMNTYFRQVLTRAAVSTLDERECLIDDLDETIWMGYFEEHVSPTVVRHKLI